MVYLYVSVFFSNVICEKILGLYNSEKVGFDSSNSDRNSEKSEELNSKHEKPRLI